MTDSLLNERRRFVVMSPGFGDSGEGAKWPTCPACPEQLCACHFSFKDSFKTPGFLTSLDEAHLAWGTISNMDMKNVGIFPQHSPGLQKLNKQWAELLGFGVLGGMGEDDSIFLASFS